jgi:hypothetical protein
MMPFTYTLLAVGFIYSIGVSYLAYRETGKKWMLFLPQWVDATSGVSRPLRLHGMTAFALLFVATVMFFGAQ